MQKNKSKLLVVVASMLSSLLGKSANASTEITWLNDTDQKDTNLTDMLLKEEIFNINSTEKTVQIDEKKLLQTIKSELVKKLASKDIKNDEKEIYEGLLKKLNPGSFGRKGDVGRELQTMDFQKPVN